MSTNLRRRLDALEAVLSPAPVVCFWAMNENCEPMTDEEIEKGIVALRANTPANARIIPMTWLSPIDPMARGPL